MFRVFIEESTSASPQHMEISPDVPIAQIIPALLEELHLPQNDSSGQRLVYFLRHTVDGRALPGHFSLRAAGIQSEDHLTLVSYAAEKKLVAAAAPASRETTQADSFYAAPTIVDIDMFADPGVPSSSLGALPAVSRTKRRWPRRAFLLFGGAVLGAAGASLAYAGFHTLSGNYRAYFPGMPRTGTSTPVGATASPRAILPTHATSQLVFTQHQQPVRALGWSPDGTLLASGADDRQMLVWGRGGQVQMRQEQHESVRAVSWSPDNHQLAVASGNEVLFLNARSGTTEARFPHTHRATVTSLAWSAQQPQILVSAGLDKLAVVWNTQAFQPQTFFRQHTAGILAAGWASDGQTLGSTSLGGVTRIWNGTTGQQLHGFFFEGAVSMNALAFAPTGSSRLAVGGDDGLLRLWSDGLTCQQMGNGDMQGQCLDKSQHFTGHTRAIRALSWSPDGRLLASAGDDGQILLWNLAQSQTPLLKIQQNAPILALSWSPDGKALASAAGNNVTIWALA